MRCVAGSYSGFCNRGSFCGFGAVVALLRVGRGWRRIRNIPRRFSLSNLLDFCGSAPVQKDAVSSERRRNGQSQGRIKRGDKTNEKRREEKGGFF